MKRPRPTPKHMTSKGKPYLKGGSVGKKKCS